MLWAWRKSNHNINEKIAWCRTKSLPILPITTRNETMCGYNSHPMGTASHTTMTVDSVPTLVALKLSIPSTQESEGGKMHLHIDKGEQIKYKAPTLQIVTCNQNLIKLPKIIMVVVDTQRLLPLVLITLPYMQVRQTLLRFKVLVSVKVEYSEGIAMLVK
mmetsp:Transcript_16923/g.20112  ORF Transcript_16923/g.20112 Transcript_16923/m.20112 type:complete len:160 (+) Transcript_16923:1569-2048(+)